MVDRQPGETTVDFSDLPQVCPPVGRAAMSAARPLPDGDTPPNMPDWSTVGRSRNVRPDMTRDPRRREGRWL